MAVQRGLLLIADIAGYTRFMEFHRTDLAHAQDVVARLLEAMIDATSALDLVEVEGDAAFMYRPLPGGTGPELVESALGQSVAMHGAFHALQQKIACLNNCPCQGCAQVGNLKVKFVAHLGDVAPQRVKRLTRLAGFDVIFVHRMLKNSVPVREYLLMSEPLWERADERLRTSAWSSSGCAPHSLASAITRRTHAGWAARGRKTSGGSRTGAGCRSSRRPSCATPTPSPSRAGGSRPTAGSTCRAARRGTRSSTRTPPRTWRSGARSWRAATSRRASAGATSSRSRRRSASSRAASASTTGPSASARW